MKLIINDKEIELVPSDVKVTSELNEILKNYSFEDPDPNIGDTISETYEKIKNIPKSPYEIEKFSYNDWCNLIAWLMNCDEMHFFNSTHKRTAKEIFESNSHGELMFVYSAAAWISRIISQINFPLEWKEKIDKLLIGEEVEPEARFTTGFGLKCRTILWKVKPEFEAIVDEIIKENWSKNA